MRLFVFGIFLGVCSHFQTAQASSSLTSSSYGYEWCSRWCDKKGKSVGRCSELNWCRRKCKRKCNYIAMSSITLLDGSSIEGIQKDRIDNNIVIITNDVQVRIPKKAIKGSQTRYYQERKTRSLIIPGTIILPLFYALSISLSLVPSNGKSSAAFLSMIPFIGSLIALSVDGASGTDTLFFILPTAGQWFGLGLIVVGMLIKKRYLMKSISQGVLSSKKSIKNRFPIIKSHKTLGEAQSLCLSKPFVLFSSRVVE